ncbi:hypothetical protein WN51_10264 [Melipona quadrifasciata]|uniref:Uncharacterized protein n=1 Tax=Melipona quadrifasciata TaxID=166423 RepID=A0A0N0U6L1_9HYME|nr:hypothetical protein WN51_10264 [Melipona quadrifasciata]
MYTSSCFLYITHIRRKYICIYTNTKTELDATCLVAEAAKGYLGKSGNYNIYILIFLFSCKDG